MNALSARALLGKIAIENQIHLASIEMLPTTSLRLAINDAGTSRWSIAAAAKQSASALCESERRLCDERNTGEMAHSRLAGQET
jgi:hypothetical protein